MIDTAQQEEETTPGADQRLDLQFCFALYSTLLGINRVYRDLLLDLDLTYPQYLVLLVLWERDGVNVSEICERLFLQTTTLTPLLKRLERRGLIARQRSHEDERQVIISLTPDGRAMRATAAHLPGCVMDATGHSPQDLTALREQLDTIRDHLFRKA